MQSSNFNMSRTNIVLIVVLSAALAGLLVFSNLRSKVHAPPPTASAQPASNPQPSATPAPVKPVVLPRAPVIATAPVTTPPRQALPSTNRGSTVGQRRLVTDAEDVDDVPLKPLPVLERDYATTTNRDTRLDIMMDIAETPGPESVRTLTRLFDIESDPELKVDLLDSLLGIEGFKDEKLVMLTLGIRPGLPSDVRQSAIDGLIDLEDTRVISLLNSLLNDPDAEIRESAQDALEIVQTPPETPKAR